MPALRVLGNIARPMQRLGYLKRIVNRVVTSTTSSLDNLGNDLVDAVTRKVRVPLTEDRVRYIKVRLFDRVYKSLKEQADQWLEHGDSSIVQMELQDLYLADPYLPSQVGKLVKEDWRKYPALGINLGLIREGTYSANTRSYSLSYLTSGEELHGFVEYLPETNPLAIDRKQGLLFLYSLLENDGEVIVPLFDTLVAQTINVFSDRDAGDLLPEIYQTIVVRHRAKSLSIDLRERLSILEKSAQSIISARNSVKYSGGSAREESSRSRVEPFVDIGLFTKPNPMKYEYMFSPIGLRWAESFSGQEDSPAIQEFLSTRFFKTAATAWEIDTHSLTGGEEIIPYLRRAAEAISSSSGYSPIEELGLLAGIEALIGDQYLLEIATARKALIDYQKTNPYNVRFTVDRLGALAHVKFLNRSDK